MKHTRFILFLSLIAFSVNAQGIVFETGTWAEALAKAKKENKIIFMDAYTVWCGPCKMLNKQTFPDEAVGKLYNANFVNVKMDMEKGEGIELAKTYSVAAYPTLLFVDGDGKMVHRALGFHPANAFLELGKTVLDPSKRIGTLETRYNNGDRNPAFLYQYLKAKSAANDPNTGAIAQEYLAAQKDFGSDYNMDIIAQYADDPTSPAYKYMLDNIGQFEAKYGKEVIQNRLSETFAQYVAERPELELGAMQRLANDVFGKKGPYMASALRLDYYMQRGEIDNFAKAAIDHFQQHPSKNAEQLNSVAWTFYEMVADKAQLKKALEWGLQSVKIKESYYNQDTVAALYAKLGKKSKAIKHGKRAIELAKADGEDYSATQNLLDSLK
jgi:thioredoxin-related protein